MQEKSLPDCARKHNLFLGWEQIENEGLGGIWHIFLVKAVSYSWSCPGNAGSSPGHVCIIYKTKQSKIGKQSSQWRVTDSPFSSIVPVSVALSAECAVGVQWRITDMLPDPLLWTVFCKGVCVMTSFKCTQPVRNSVSDIFWVCLEFSSFPSP